MKSIYKRVLVLLILGAVFMPVFAAGNKNQYVSVGSAQVKAKASQFAKTVATLKYGDEVIIVEAKKEWSNIKSLDGKVEGWVPNSSLTTKKLIVKVKSNKGTSANAEELALAGKGWSEWFEQALEDNEPKSYNFTAVETIETYTATDADTIAFIKEGKLYLGGEE